MSKLSVISVLLFWFFFRSESPAQNRQDSVYVGRHGEKPRVVVHIKNENLAELINRVGGIPATQAELDLYKSGKQVPFVSILVFRNGKKTRFMIDPKKNDISDFLVLGNDVVHVRRVQIFERSEYPARIILTKPKVE